MEKWNYKGDADIVIGELHEGRASKIALVVLAMSIIALITSVFYYREDIYDYIVKPEIWLTEKEIELDVSADTFNYEDYIYRLPDNLDKYKVVYPKNTDVKLGVVGKYKVEYKLIKQNGEERISTLIVNIVDKESPVITLTKKEDTLTRTKDTFNCETYIKSVTDNYDKEVKAKCDSNIKQDDEVKVEYTATDKSGNKATEVLTIKWKDVPKHTCWDNSVVENEKDCPVKPTPTPTPQPAQTPTYSQPAAQQPAVQQQQTQTQQPAASTPKPAAQPAQQSQSAYINASNCTVKVGDMAGLQSCLSNISTNVQVAINYSSVNMTIPGSYPVTYSGGGITKTVTVTVKE